MEKIEQMIQVLAEKDSQTLEARAHRMAEVRDLTYEGLYTPTREYLEELDRLYVDGHFMATIIFSGSIVEHLLKQKLYAVSNVDRIERATLGTLCNIAKKKKIISEVVIHRLLMIKQMRNLLVHSDADSEFARELMDAAYSDVTYDPVVQRIWFFSSSIFSLMAKICAEIAREFAANEYKNTTGTGN